MDLKENILNIAQRNFFQKGLRQVSMDEIAEEAGISKRTLYELYKSKEQLIADVIYRNFDSVLTQMATFIEEMRQNGCNSLETLVRIYIFSRQCREKINEIVFDELRKYYPTLNSTQIQTLQTKHDQLLDQLSLDCKQAGFIREDVNTDLIFHLFRDLHNDKLQYVASGKYTASDIVAYLILPLIRSIGTYKGHRAFFKTIRSLDDPYSKQLLNSLSL